MVGLGFIFIVLPISIILFDVWIFTQKKIFEFGLIGIWIGLIKKGVIPVNRSNRKKLMKRLNLL